MTLAYERYDPDAAIGEFGWLWIPNNFGYGWALVYTDLPDGIDARPQMRLIERDLGGDCDVTDDADAFKGRLYLPLLSPPVVSGPGAAS